MWQDFTLGEVQRHLQGDEDGELEGNQLPPADPETLLQLLQTRQKQSMRQTSHKSLIICLNVSPRSCVYMFWWCSINNWVPSQDQTSALSRLPAEALCWTDSRTLVKYESFTPKHVNVDPGLKIQEFTFKLCTKCSTCTLRWLIQLKNSIQKKWFKSSE